MLSSDEQEELNEQAAQYHREDMPWEMMVNMQPPTGKGELKHSGLSKEQLENLIQKIVIAVKKEAQGDSHSSQPVPPACPPSVLGWALSTSAFCRTLRAYIYPCFFAQ